MDPVRRIPVQLITISREYGAGGSELGMALGERLGLARARPRAGSATGSPPPL